MFKRTSQSVLRVLPVAEVSYVLNLLTLKQRWMLNIGIRSKEVTWYLVDCLFLHLKFSHWL